MKLIRRLGAITAISAAALLTTSLSFATTLVVDGFESKNLSAVNGSAGVVNTNGFSWGGTNYTSVVGMVNNLATRVFNGSVINEVLQGSDFTCYVGTYCLRFRYPAGEYMAEQRFDIGTARPELWMSYWIRVPKNFTHPSTTPNNQKFLALWMDGYEGQGDGPTAWLSFFNNGSGGSTLGVTYSIGQHTGSLAYQQFKPFITVPSDRGRWMQIVFHIKAATNRSSNDGVLETWRRWSNETSFTKFHEVRNANMAPSPSGPNGWKAGYLMGWANGAYSSETEWLIDDFRISTDDSLLAGGQTSQPPTSTQSPPAAPVLQVR
jgi:hypothetical protein